MSLLHKLNTELEMDWAQDHMARVAYETDTVPVFSSVAPPRNPDPGLAETATRAGTSVEESTEIAEEGHWTDAEIENAEWMLGSLSRIMATLPGGTEAVTRASTIEEGTTAALIGKDEGDDRPLHVNSLLDRQATRFLTKGESRWKDGTVQDVYESLLADSAKDTRRTSREDTPALELSSQTRP